MGVTSKHKIITVFYLFIKHPPKVRPEISTAQSTKGALIVLKLPIEINLRFYGRKLCFMATR